MLGYEQVVGKGAALTIDHHRHTPVGHNRRVHQRTSVREERRAVGDVLADMRRSIDHQHVPIAAEGHPGDLFPIGAEDRSL